MKITRDMVEQAYTYGKKVYSDEVSRNQAKYDVHTTSGMDTGSAQDYITVFLGMMNGEEYHRTINTYATEYYLENIEKDYGLDALKKAVTAVDLHTKYYKTLDKGSLVSIENIVKSYKERYTT